jgi:hypothetical protein
VGTIDTQYVGSTSIDIRYSTYQTVWVSVTWHWDGTIDPWSSPLVASPCAVVAAVAVAVLVAATG